MADFTFRAVAMSGQSAVGGGGSTYGDFSRLAGGPPIVTIQGETIAFVGLLSGGPNHGKLAIWRNSDCIFEPLVMTGAPAPGTAQTFQSVAYPVCCRDGRILILGLLPGGVSGAWSYQNGSLQLIAYEGQAAVGVSGATYSTPPGEHPFTFPPAVAANGQACFNSYMKGPSLFKDEGLWTGGLPPVNLALQSGATPPTLPPGVTVDSYITGPVMNGAGLISFVATTHNTQSSGLFLGNATKWVMAVQQGQIAPGTGSTFSGLQGWTPALNDAGMYAFLADSYAATGIWANTRGYLQAVAINGQPAPGFPVGWTLYGGAFDPPLLSANGLVVFWGGAQTTGQSANGLWSWSADVGLTPIAIGNAVAPGTGGLRYVPGFEGTVCVGEKGDIAFTGYVGASGGLANGMWYQAVGGTPKLVALEGQPMVLEGVTKTVKTLFSMASGGPQNGLETGMGSGGEIVFVAAFTDGTSAVVASRPGEEGLRGERQGSVRLAEGRARGPTGRR